MFHEIKTFKTQFIPTKRRLEDVDFALSGKVIGEEALKVFALAVLAKRLSSNK